MKIFIHGLGQTSKQWSQTLRALPDGDSVYCPNLWELPYDQPLTYERLFSAFATECQKYTEPLELCGLSLGAVLALNYATAYPAHVRKLALIAPQYEMPKHLMRLQGFIFRCLPRRAFQTMGIEKSSAISLCSSMASLQRSSDLDKASMPALIVCGSKDRANSSAAKALRERLPNAELIWMEGAGHEVNRTHPNELSACLAAFFGKEEGVVSDKTTGEHCC